MRILFSLFITLFIALTACSPQKNLNQNPTAPNHPQDNQVLISLESRSLKVSDENGQAIYQPKILIGDKLGSPFKDNFLKGSDSGDFLAPDSWNQPLTITIEAPGFVRATYLNQIPKGQTFTLHKKLSNEKIEIKGVANGFGDLKKDGTMHFAAVFTALPSQSLMGLSVGHLLSSETDEMTAAGQTVLVPSNFSIPRQKQSYIIPITLEKSVYRMQVSNSPNQTMIALRGGFPFKKTVDDIKSGKSFFEILNSVNFVSYGTAAISLPTSQLDLQVNQVSLVKQTPVQAPQFDSNLTAVAIALDQSTANSIPTDFKKLEPAQAIQLTAVNNQNTKVLSILGTKVKHQNTTEDFESGRSYALTSSSKGTHQPQFLKIEEKPSQQGGRFAVFPPESISGVKPLGTYASIKTVEITDTKDVYKEEESLKWEFYSSDWVQEIPQPEWPNPSQEELITTARQRLDVIHLGSDKEYSDKETGLNNVGPKMLELATHASENSLDY